MSALIERLTEDLTRKMDSVVELVAAGRARLVDPDRMMTTSEVADMCQVDEREVQRWAKVGLPRYQMGKGYRFKRVEVLRFIEQFRMVEQ